MAARTTTGGEWNRPQKEFKQPRSLERLLLSIPLDTLLKMAAKSGLPTEESRELAAAFREIKK